MQVNALLSYSDICIDYNSHTCRWYTPFMTFVEKQEILGYKWIFAHVFEYEYGAQLRDIRTQNIEYHFETLESSLSQCNQAYKGKNYDTQRISKNVRRNADFAEFYPSIPGSTKCTATCNNHAITNVLIRTFTTRHFSSCLLLFPNIMIIVSIFHRHWPPRQLTGNWKLYRNHLWRNIFFLLAPCLTLTHRFSSAPYVLVLTTLSRICDF